MANRLSIDFHAVCIVETPRRQYLRRLAEGKITFDCKQQYNISDRKSMIGVVTSKHNADSVARELLQQLQNPDLIAEIDAGSG